MDLILNCDTDRPFIQVAAVRYRAESCVEGEGRRCKGECKETAKNNKYTHSMSVITVKRLENNERFSDFPQISQPDKHIPGGKAAAVAPWKLLNENGELLNVHIIMYIMPHHCHSRSNSGIK